jgi:hypothetical protein
VLLDKMCLLHHTADTNEKIVGNIAHGLVVGASAEILQRPSAAVVFADPIWALGATGKIVWPIQGARESACILSKQKDLNRLGRGNDALISSSYANEFASQIINSQVEITKLWTRAASGTAPSSSFWSHDSWPKGELPFKP